MPVFAQTVPGLQLIDHLLIGAYLVGILALGVVLARRQKSTDDFFVGGRKLPSWAVGISMFATLFSTITYLGMPGEMFRSGVAFLTREIPLPLVLAVVWFLWLPFFMRLNLTSAYEYLERRFNYPVRATAAIFCLMLVLGWIAVVVLTASQAMIEIAQFRVPVGPDPVDGAMYTVILAVGIMSVLYTTMGGITADIWTDVAQFVILLTGAIFTMLTIASMTGSNVSDWLAVSQEYQHEEVRWFDWDVTNRSTVFTISLNMFFWFICTHGANQVALQRYFTVKDTWAARRTYLVSAVASFGVALLLAGVGISLMYFLQDHDLPVKAELMASEAGARGNLPDKVFTQFISHYMPTGLKGMVVCALFAAAMSTIDSGANSASTIVMVDFLRPFSGGNWSRRRELAIARVLTATFGLLVVAYTILLYNVSKGTNVIDLMQKGFNCFLGGLGGLFVLAMFTRTIPAVALIALLVGETVGVLASYSEDVFAVRYSTHLVVPTAWLATVLTGVILNLLCGGRASEEQMRWTWRAVTRRTEAMDTPPTTD